MIGVSVLEVLQGQAFLSDSEKFDHSKIDHDNIMTP